MRVIAGLPASLLAVRRKLRPCDALVPCAGKDSIPHLIWLNAEGIGSRNNAAELGDGGSHAGGPNRTGRSFATVGPPFISGARFSLTCVNAPAPHCVIFCFLTETRSRAMSWGSYWISLWMLLGPMMTVLVMIVCMAGMFFMMRVGTVHRSSAEIGPTGLSFGFARNSRDSPTPFEKYRLKTLSRSDQGQREFQELIDPLRAANGKAKSDRLMAERRSRLLSCG
jgi:hypothetical protein